MPRRYVMQQRAESRDATGRRIVDAAIEVRSARGGDRTLTAIAARAGVSRLTVYRHFPDEVDLAKACMTRYVELHPPPDPAAWAAIASPATRLHHALTELYAWYRDNEAMLTNSAVDQFADPRLAEALAPVTAGFEAMQQVVSAGWSVVGAESSMVDPAIDHALAFTTWLSLCRGQGLSQVSAVALMVRLVEAARAS
jgi:AcrR family transcriptional regulator